MKVFLYSSNLFIVTPHCTLSLIDIKSILFSDFPFNVSAVKKKMLFYGISGIYEKETFKYDIQMFNFFNWELLALDRFSN